MRRVTATLALALFVVGCSAAQAGISEAPTAQPSAARSVESSGRLAELTGEPVELATGAGNDPYLPEGACRPMSRMGLLIADPKAGVLLNETIYLESGEVAYTRMIQLIWPLGFTARRLAGGEVVVLDNGGNVVATTGQNWEFWVRAGDPIHPVSGCIQPWPHPSPAH